MDTTHACPGTGAPLVDVVDVAALEGYRIAVAFEDGRRGVFDMSPYLARDTGVFAALRDQGMFRAVRVENGTATWPNGADMAPELLYEGCAEA